MYQARWKLWARVIHQAAAWGPVETVLVLEVDDSTKKKAGHQSEGVAPYRNGAGSARQEYRTLRGLNFVGGIMRVPLGWWPGHWVSIPIGLSRSLKQPQARELAWPYRSRSALAREIVEFVAAELPTRTLRVAGDGGYATKEYLQDRSPTGEVVSRMLINGVMSLLEGLEFHSKRWPYMLQPKFVFHMAIGRIKKFFKFRFFNHPWSLLLICLAA